VNEFRETAVAKLTGEVGGVSGMYENVMKGAVCDALVHFCEEDAEFAQAVAQGGSFADCMKAVAQGVGGSCSDLDAFRKAVQFYFPGADIRFEMRIDLCASVAEGENKINNGVLIDLDSFF